MKEKSENIIPINRNNYEEYFLLYADDELNAVTKLAVERFTQQNTDLAVELEMLMQTKSTPQKIVFANKEDLLRTEGNSINETNYEEYFLLYLDNELSAVKREEVEMYVLQHPKLQDAFTGLKQAVITQEIINYGDKTGLYRTEKRRTVYIKPWRLAAAAILIGVCAVGWWLWQTPVHINALADNHLMQNQTKQKTFIIKPADTINNEIKKPEPIVAQTLPRLKNKVAEKIKVEKEKPVMPIIKQADIAEHKLLPQQENKNNAIRQDNIVKENDQPVIKNNDIAVKHVPTLQNSTENIITAPKQSKVNNESNNNYKVYDVAYKEINTNDEDNSLHVGAFDLNKNKVKNLLKKAGRMFINKQNRLEDDDGTLHVASFKINTIKQ